MGDIRMDWTTMRVLLAAVELGSIAKAAERCGIAGSAAAKRLRDLDAECGTAVLARGARGVRPTAAGEAVTRHARAMLDLSSRFSSDLRSLAAGGGGTVRILATASVVAGPALGPALAGFSRTNPGIRLELEELTSAAILHQLTQGRAELGLITTGGTVPAVLDAHPWRFDRLVLVVSAAHALASRPSICFEEVLDHPLVRVQGGGALSLLLAEAAWRLGKRMDIRAEVTGSDAARSLLAAGLGLAVMPEALHRPDEAAGSLVAVPLAEPWARRELRLVARPDAVLPSPARLMRDALLRPTACADGAG